MQETILITGGSGLVGTRLTSILLKQGYSVRHISRHKGISDNIKSFQWNLEDKKWDKEAIEGVDYVIHLAGAGVADGRWSTKRKQQILKSRVVGSQLVCEMVVAAKGKIKGVVSSSAVGYYGLSSGNTLINEEADPGNDFLAEVCSQWEKAIYNCASQSTKVAILRTGIVLSKNGGALPKMLAPVKLGAGSPLGSGQQLMPWIHIDDLCGMYIHAMEKDLAGIYNAVAPNPVSNKVFTQLIAKAINRRLLLPNVPGFILKLLLGEMSQMLLIGVNPSVEKIKWTGFEWKYEKLEDTLDALLGVK